MTAPASTIIEVQYTTPQPAWQVAANADFWTVLTTLCEAGYTCSLLATPNPVTPSAPNFQLTLNLPEFPTLIAAPGEWITFDGQHANVYSNAEFTSVFTQAT